MSNHTTFCDLKTFAKSYGEVHGYLSFLVCVFGSVANILNICVLTTKEMRWPTNLILTGLAIADLLVMLDYIPFTFHRYLNIGHPKTIGDFSYNWAVFMNFHALFSQVLHFISCCLTVILAIWRYITITNPHTSRVWCSMRNTLIVIVATYILCPLVCTPLFTSLYIKPHNQSCDLNGTLLDKKQLQNFTGTVDWRFIYLIDYKDKTLSNVNFWVYSVVLKLVPCILLTQLSWRLISVLLETKRRRRLLLNSSVPLKAVNASNSSGKAVVIRNKADKDRQADRTSSMLVAVLLLFLITEFPQAILGLLSAIIGKTFADQCLWPLGDLMDILALTNSAINFILYCTMSRQFRSTFREVFWPKIFDTWLPVRQHSGVEKNGLVKNGHWGTMNNTDL